MGSVFNVVAALAAVALLGCGAEGAAGGPCRCQPPNATEQQPRAAPAPTASDGTSGGASPAADPAGAEAGGAAAPADLGSGTFALPADHELLALGGEGDQLFFASRAGDAGRVGRVERNGQMESARGPKDPVAVYVHGQGDDARTIVLGRRGGMALWEAGRWHTHRVPIMEDDTLVGVTVWPESGQIYVAGRQHAMYRFGRNRYSWHLDRYPEGTDAIGLARRDVGIWVLTGQGRVHTWRNGGFGLDAPLDLAGTQAKRWRAMWSDPAGGRVWVLTRRKLLAVELARERVATHEPPIDGALTVVSGVRSDTGVEVLVASDRGVALFGPSGFRVLDAQRGADDAWIDAAEGVVYLLEYGSPRTLPL